MSTRLVSLTALSLLAAFPGGASATPVPDRVLAEVTAPLGVGIDGSVVAYSRRVGTRGVEVVVRDGDRPAVRLAAGRGIGAVDVGRDRRDRVVVVYARCGGRCDLVAFGLAVGRTRVVVRGVRATDVTVGRGRVFWTDGKRVRSRSLDGGPVRGEAVAGRMDPTEIDTDGTTLAATGEVPFDDGNGATGLSVTRVGSGRARLRGSRGYGEEYAAIRSPVVTRAGVTTLLDSFPPGVAPGFADFAAGTRGFTGRTAGGMKLLDWDAAGSSAVFVEAPTDVGCGVGDAFADEKVLDAPCRIVRAELGGERLLPPRVAISGATATVLRTTLLGGEVTGRQGLPGVAVELLRDGRVVGQLVTDAQGRVPLPAGDMGGPLAVVAATEPRSYAYNGG